jgi:hypothetical protein
MKLTSNHVVALAISDPIMYTTHHRTFHQNYHVPNQIICVLTFALAGNFATALISYWACEVLRDTIRPIYSTWLTQNSDAKVRATIISMSGQLDAVGQIVGGPIVGVISTLASIRAALLATGVLPLYAGIAPGEEEHRAIVSSSSFNRPLLEDCRMELFRVRSSSPATPRDMWHMHTSKATTRRRWTNTQRETHGRPDKHSYR